MLGLLADPLPRQFVDAVRVFFNIIPREIYNRREQGEAIALCTGRRVGARLADPCRGVGNGPVQAVASGWSGAGGEGGLNDPVYY
jgi:hypothetical protein